MTSGEIKSEIEAIFARAGLSEKLSGELPVTCPLSGEWIGALTIDSAGAIDAMVERSVVAQAQWKIDREVRVEFLRLIMAKIRENTPELARLVHLNSGKSVHESTADVASTATLIENTIKAASYEPLPGGVERSKEYTPLGVIAIIEPFNFFSIKLWTGIPALLAGNTVICKASENSALPSILFVEIVRSAIGEFNAGRTADLVPAEVFQVVVGGPEAGRALVAHPQIARVVVTGSITVCEHVKEADRKLGRDAKALTEGGAANFVIVSAKHEGIERSGYLNFVTGAVLKSVLPYAGQKCIGARLLIVHENIIADFIEAIQTELNSFGQTWGVENALLENNPFEFTPLINARAGQQFEWALRQTVEQGGNLFGGERLASDRYPNAYYYRPAFGVFEAPVALMREEIFGPYFAIISYAAGIENALDLAQKPNARLVNAYYGSDPAEAKLFQRRNDAGFTLINPPQGTGLLPPYGLGFGGNGLSGQGESFARDPESAFVQPAGNIKRTVTFKLPGKAG